MRQGRQLVAGARGSGSAVAVGLLRLPVAPVRQWAAARGARSMSGPISSLQRQQQRGWSQCSPLQPGSSSNCTGQATRGSSPQLPVSSSKHRQGHVSSWFGCQAAVATQQCCTGVGNTCCSQQRGVWIPEAPIIMLQSADSWAARVYWVLFCNPLVPVLGGGMLARMVPSVWTYEHGPSAQHSHWGSTKAAAEAVGGTWGTDAHCC